MTWYVAFDTLFSRTYAAQTLGTYPPLVTLGTNSPTNQRLYVVASNNPGQAGGLLVGSGGPTASIEQFIALPATGLCEFTIQYRASDGALNVAVGTGAFAGFGGAAGAGAVWPGNLLGSNQAGFVGGGGFRIRDLIVAQGLHSYTEMLAIPQS
jgi:hypothetical protein